LLAAHLFDLGRLEVLELAQHGDSGAVITHVLLHLNCIAPPEVLDFLLGGDLPVHFELGHLMNRYEVGIVNVLFEKGVRVIGKYEGALLD
jgi:hypothetical protein